EPLRVEASKASVEQRQQRNRRPTPEPGGEARVVRDRWRPHGVDGCVDEAFDVRTENAAVLVKMPKIAGAPRHMRTVNQTTRFRCADRVCAGQRSWIACMRARTASSRTYMIAPPSAGHVLIAPKLNMATSALG